MLSRDMLGAEVIAVSTLINKCPSCHAELEISVLRCPDCGLELKNNFELSVFDRLSKEHVDYLMAFLRNRGNLKSLQNELRISYPLAKKKLDELLSALGIEREEDAAAAPEETIDLSGIAVDSDSTKASEIVKAKLVAAGGRAMVRLYGGELREITACQNGREFLCPQLIPYSYEVFDAIVDLLLRSPGCRARKGNARNYKLGEPGCEESTVAGTVLTFMGKKPGESGLDPVFLLAAVLDWAGIATNGRGEVCLTAAYRSRL